MVRTRRLHCKGAGQRTNCKQWNETHSHVYRGGGGWQEQNGRQVTKTMAAQRHNGQGGGSHLVAGKGGRQARVGNVCKAHWGGGRKKKESWQAGRSKRGWGQGWEAGNGGRGRVGQGVGPHHLPINNGKEGVRYKSGMGNTGACNEPGTSLHTVIKWGSNEVPGNRWVYPRYTRTGRQKGAGR